MYVCFLYNFLLLIHLICCTDINNLRVNYIGLRIRERVRYIYSFDAYPLPPPLLLTAAIRAINLRQNPRTRSSITRSTVSLRHRAINVPALLFAFITKASSAGEGRQAEREGGREGVRIFQTPPVEIVS